MIDAGTETDMLIWSNVSSNCDHQFGLNFRTYPHPLQTSAIPPQRELLEVLEEMTRCSQPQRGPCSPLRQREA